MSDESSALDRFFGALPTISISPAHNPPMWFALGTSHGLWLMYYDVTETQVAIWVALAASVVFSLGGDA